MAHQLTFELPVRAALGRDDFFVSPANSTALGVVDEWAHWPGQKLVLTGPKGSGKTHLSHVWAADAKAQVIPAHALRPDNVAALISAGPRIAVEDADQIAGHRDGELALFHLHNLALADGGCLLLSAQSDPTNWPLTLPDLKSRIQGSATVALNPPDDALLAAVLVKLFSDRQIDVSATVISYLASRMERSFAGAGTLVAALDAEALKQGRPITRQLGAHILDKLSQADA